METVSEMRAMSSYEDFAALRQQLAELQRTHDKELRDVEALDTSAGAELQNDEPVTSLSRNSQQQQDDMQPDLDGSSAFAATQVTADAISDLRAHLDKLAEYVPAVQRLRTGRVPTAS